MNLPDDGRIRNCYFCGHDLHDDPEYTAEEHERSDGDEWQPPLEQVYCPWEDQDNLGMFAGLYGTLRASMFMPSGFFSVMPKDAGFLYPLLFVMIVSTLGAMGSMIWGFFLDSPMFSNGRLDADSALLLGLTLPLTIPVTAFLNSALLHLSLKIVSAANSDFQSTFRVVCYSSGPDLLNLIIPALGPAISFVWQLIISVIGLSVVHDVSTARVAFALFTLLLIMVGLVLLFVVLFIMFG
jgi:hypothetical protein